MLKSQPNFSFPYEMLLSLQEEDSNELTLSEQKNIYQRLIHMFPDRGISSIGLGTLVSQVNRDITRDRQQLATMNEDARAFLAKGLKSSPESLYGWLVLANLLVENLSFQGVVESVSKGLKCVEMRRQETHTPFKR